ncbi:hypothetical protein [Paenibacillus algorifonticola]|uniref:hypothetical protein n=1 Tax=Paenibacillus algorifonticola TaxID=684063 RepID=UPI000A4FA624|nr:hypothetical protein [Paenibacillus algorifonticola]
MNGLFLADHVISFADLHGLWFAGGTTHPGGGDADGCDVRAAHCSGDDSAAFLI